MRFLRRSGGFDMIVHGSNELWIEAAGARVERHASDPRALRLAAPHVLALRGRAVLHASAVLSKAGVVAFVGPSGVGKSTIARALEREGARVVARDLLVLDGRRRAGLDGEASIARWSRRSSLTVGTEPLTPPRVEVAPLSAVMLVERSGATETSLRIEPLRGSAAIAALLENAFVELPDPRVWRDALATSRALAAAGLVRRALVPEGLPTLQRALSAWLRALR